MRLGDRKRCKSTVESEHRLAGLGVWAPADFWAFDSMRRGPIPQTLPPLRRRANGSSPLGHSSPLHQKSYPPHPIPFIRVQAEGKGHFGRQLLRVPKPDAVHRLALVLEL